MSITQKCKIDGCDKKGITNSNGNYYFTRGYCRSHYEKFRRNGTLTTETESHGMTKTRIYKTWTSMKNRCYNKNDYRYPRYGGRGIYVCERWLNSFTNFYEDMGDKPDQNLSLDRIDNDKGYSPENCRWATKIEQATNRQIVKDNPTGHKGIYKRKGNKYYEVYTVGITPNRYIGIRYTIEDAIELQNKYKKRAYF